MDYEQKYKEARSLLKEAFDHLEYCGFGDSWERECSVNLRDRLYDYFSDEQKEAE